MRIFVLNDPKSSALATSFYIDHVCKKLGFNGMHFVDSLREIPDNSWLFFLQPKDFFKSLFFRKKFKTITWFQGVLPEEVFLTKKSTTKYIGWNILEKLALLRSDWCLFVSDAMRQHYRSKYRYEKNNFSIAPCVNRIFTEGDIIFNLQSWTSRPEYSFIYAGSLHDWQCVQETLLIFKKIRETINPCATLTFVTENVSQAKIILSGYDFTNIKFISLSGSELDFELKKHRFGFLLRRDSIINHVATPTKMSTYLMSGVLPIVTDAVDIYKDLKLGNSNLAFDSSLIDNPIDFCIHFSKFITYNATEDNISRLIDNYFQKIDSYFNNINSPL